MSLESPPVAIFSLTEPGRILGGRLAGLISDVTHYHRPDSFVKTAQSEFVAGRRCVFICATGIVIRALAPVLKDKYQDPAVLILDENGQYVIPLLSGHEGGGCEWGRVIAEILSAQLVITSATDYSQPVYTIGLGCDRGCPVDYLNSLYQSVIDQLPDRKFSSMASIHIKSEEPGLLELSRFLNLPFKVYETDALRAVENQLSVKSEIVFKEVGCYGVAEAAALCAASELTGQSAELVLEKQKNARATIAVARSYMA